MKELNRIEKEAFKKEKAILKAKRIADSKVKAKERGIKRAKNIYTKKRTGKDNDVKTIKKHIVRGIDRIASGELDKELSKLCSSHTFGAQPTKKKVKPKCGKAKKPVSKNIKSASDVIVTKDGTYVIDTMGNTTFKPRIKVSSKIKKQKKFAKKQVDIETSKSKVNVLVTDRGTYTKNPVTGKIIFKPSKK
jgi:hypothetical protein